VEKESQKLCRTRKNHSTWRWKWRAPRARRVTTYKACSASNAVSRRNWRRALSRASNRDWPTEPPPRPPCRPRRRGAPRRGTWSDTPPRMPPPASPTASFPGGAARPAAAPDAGDRVVGIDRCMARREEDDSSPPPPLRHPICLGGGDACSSFTATFCRPLLQRERGTAGVWTGQWFLAGRGVEAWRRGSRGSSGVQAVRDTERHKKTVDAGELGRSTGRREEPNSICRDWGRVEGRGSTAKGAAGRRRVPERAGSGGSRFAGKRQTGCAGIWGVWRSGQRCRRTPPVAGAGRVRGNDRCAGIGGGWRSGAALVRKWHDACSDIRFHAAAKPNGS
jgi:hypothetical protein